MDNKAQILQQCLDAVDTLNLDPVRSLYSPTAQIAAPGAELRGADQILAWYGIFVKAFPDIKHQVRGTVQDADTCVLQARATGTHTGRSPRPPATSHLRASRSCSTT